MADLVIVGTRSEPTRLMSDRIPNNLPRQLTSFIGREDEILGIERLLAESRLVTITGSGGCGKSRLALQVAAEVSDDDTPQRCPQRKQQSTPEQLGHRAARRQECCDRRSGQANWAPLAP